MVLAQSSNLLWHVCVVGHAGLMNDPVRATRVAQPARPIGVTEAVPVVERCPSGPSVVFQGRVDAAQSAFYSGRVIAVTWEDH